MTEQQAQAEFNYAFFIGMRDRPEVVKTANDIYGEGTAQARQCIAEVTHFCLLGRLPAWGTIIERVESVDDNFIFIHRDRVS